MNSAEEISFNVEFVKAEELMAGDSNGLSDPYVKVGTGQTGIYVPEKGYKTKYIKNTLSPQWNENFDFKLIPGRAPPVFAFEVYDHDMIGRDDFLGYGNIPLDFLPNLGKGLFENWIDLYHPVKDKKTKAVESVKQGKVLVRIRINPGFVPGNWIEMKENAVYVGLGWDFVPGTEKFDLDASIAGFDGGYNCHGYAYYHNLSAFNGAIKHKGDNRTGEGAGDDEVISVHLDKVPMSIIYLAVTVNSYTMKSMIGAKSAYIRLFLKDKKKELGKFKLIKTKDCIGLLFGLFERKPGTNSWFFRVMVDPLGGRAVTESIDDLKVLLKGYSLTAPQQPQNAVYKHPFPNETIFQPGNWFEIKCAVTHIGLGWDFVPGQTYDLDASVISFDEKNTVLDVVFFKQPGSRDMSIRHLGDNRIGIGEGDDEIISVYFPQVHPSVSTIAVIVNSFKGNSLLGVKSGFIRLFDEQSPIGVHLLQGGRDTTGLLLGLFRRNPEDKKFYFQVMIENLRGTQATESMEDVKNIMDKYILNK